MEGSSGGGKFEGGREKMMMMMMMGLFSCLEFKEEGTYKFTIIFPEGAFHFLITLTWFCMFICHFLGVIQG